MKATPHMVMSNPISNGISRNTFALFLNPNFDEIMSTPDGHSAKRVIKEDLSIQVPSLNGRWLEGDTFENFENLTFKKYYDFNM